MKKLHYLSQGQHSIIDHTI